mmetsp:Transcript_51447/g.159292  ORF Transcript_51447/g.159292 Transcript_51447/m.159292 type:complete len:248 (+) Transcript_51447:878-1621(+)
MHLRTQPASLTSLAQPSKVSSSTSMCSPRDSLPSSSAAGSGSWRTGASACTTSKTCTAWPLLVRPPCHPSGSGAGRGGATSRSGSVVAGPSSGAGHSDLGSGPDSSGPRPRCLPSMSEKASVPSSSSSPKSQPMRRIWSSVSCAQACPWLSITCLGRICSLSPSCAMPTVRASLSAACFTNTIFFTTLNHWKSPAGTSGGGAVRPVVSAKGPAARPAAAGAVARQPPSAAELRGGGRGGAAASGAAV